MRFTARKKNKAGLKNKALGLLLVIILIFFVINFFQGWQKNRQIDKEVKGLEGEISTLEAGNSKLNELIKYFNSNAYIEEKARVDLGLKKEGEKVIIVSGQAGRAGEGSKDAENNGEEQKIASNPQKWLKYFFR